MDEVRWVDTAWSDVRPGMVVRRSFAAEPAEVLGVQGYHGDIRVTLPSGVLTVRPVNTVWVAV